jgi:hypothetical protein
MSWKRKLFNKPHEKVKKGRLYRTAAFQDPDRQEYPQVGIGAHESSKS